MALPFVVRSLVPALQQHPAPAAAGGAGAGGPARRACGARWTCRWSGRALLVGAAFAFTISLGEFGATAVIARPEHPTVPMAIFRLLGLPGALNYGQALAMSTILMAIAAAGILAIERLRVGEVGEF